MSAITSDTIVLTTVIRMRYVRYDSVLLSLQCTFMKLSTRNLKREILPFVYSEIHLPLVLFQFQLQVSTNAQNALDIEILWSWARASSLYRMISLQSTVISISGGVGTKDWPSRAVASAPHMQDKTCPVAPVDFSPICCVTLWLFITHYVLRLWRQDNK